MAIIGFDDIPIAALVTPSLTTCQIPHYDLGSGAMRLLLDQIADCEGELQNILIRPNLVVRDSAPYALHGVLTP